MDPYANGPDHFEWEELRLGLVMNGGVSLAVWMGGVSNEIFRLVTHQHPVYRGLMELTRTSARVDVISGTSAGGVNGAAFALALLYGGDFYALRKVWMDTGAFTDLLRSPLGKNPGSLLKGEEYFLPAIEAAFADLAACASKPRFKANIMPIDLRLTTTLLSGHQGRNVDDLGTPVHDVDYRANFRFERCEDNRDPSSAPDVFELEPKAAMVKALARAARSTSSFPFAFEPSLISEDAGNWLFTTHDVELKTPRYAIDGGIMDNKPLRGAREGIFKMPRRGSVRRVMAYVNPDPGDGKPFDLSKAPEMPGLAPVLAAAIVGVPQSQSISDELQELEAHNLKVRMRRESAVSLAVAFSSQDDRLGTMAANLFDIYRQRRLTTTFELFVFQPLSNAGSRQPRFVDALSSIGKYGKETIKRAFLKEEGYLKNIGRGWLPDGFPTTAGSACNVNSPDWCWGLFPVEFASKLAMDILRMMQSLVIYRFPAAAGRYAAKQVDCPVPMAGMDWSDAGEAWDPDGLKVHLKAFVEPRSPGSTELADLWKRSYEIVSAILIMRNKETTYWRNRMDKALENLARLKHPVSARALTIWHARTVRSLFALIATEKRRKDCADLAHRLAAIVHEASGLIGELCTPAPGAPPMLSSDVALRETLRSLEICFKDLTVEETLYKFLQMEVVEFAFNDHESLSTDSLIELLQISGNSRSPLGGFMHASDKLLGLQLAHFGAFYKESWRANDWTFGRLDGSAHLVAALLNPRRLHQIYGSGANGCAAAAAAIKDIAKESVCPGPLRDYLDAQWRKKCLDLRIAEELKFLDTTNLNASCLNVPDRLPHCEMAIGMRLHLGILREELPQLRLAIIRDQNNGADAMWSGQDLLSSLEGRAVDPVAQADRADQVVRVDAANRAAAAAPSAAAAASARHASNAPFSPEAAASALAAGLLTGPNQNGENFRKEAGSDLFTRTLAHTLATLQNTLSSGGAKLGPVAVLFASLRLPTLGFHFVAQGLTRQSRTAAALHATMLMVGLTLVLLSLWNTKPMDGALVQFGWLILGFGLTISVIRAPNLFLVAAFAGFLGIAAAMVFFHWPFESMAILFLLVLLMGGVRFPVMQFWIAALTIGLAASFSAGVVADPSSLKLTIYHVAGLCTAVLGLALLDACGTLRRLDKRLRRLTIKSTSALNVKWSVCRELWPLRKSDAGPQQVAAGEATPPSKES
jgi:patatin-related protein